MGQLDALPSCSNSLLMTRELNGVCGISHYLHKNVVEAIEFRRSPD